MLISFNWIKEFVKFSLPSEELAERLTMLGLEVAEIRKVNQPIPGLVIGEVVSKEKHPHADRLALTTIRYRNAGNDEEILPVICGAPNIAVGQKIAYATIGTVLPNGLKLRKAKIRGVESHGMVCSLQELGKEEISETIWVLPETAELSEPVAQYMGVADDIFDIEVTSNRSDAMSVIGVAREAAALLETDVKQPDYVNKIHEVSGKQSLRTLDITVRDHEDTPRYMALAVANVKVRPSPRWLCDKLHTHGLRPINNIVDITNLIMLEYGQPLHAFDGGVLSGNGIIVRRAEAGETLVTLDEREVLLAESDLIIADKRKPIGLAGVMGGVGSGITEETQEVIIEAAYFSGSAVKATASRTGFDTEAAKRFIRGTVDLEFTPQALCKAALLMVELGGGTISSTSFDSLKALPKAPVINLSTERILKDLNLSLTETEITSYLNRIGCSLTRVSGEGDAEFQVTPPLFRKDLKYEWDLIEEVARLYGYDRIPVTFPQARHGDYKMIDPLAEAVHQTACALGYYEIITYPFIEEGYFKATGEAMGITPVNPVVPSASVLRTSMLPGALKTLRLNHEKRNILQGRFFENGHIFRSSLTELSSTSASGKSKQKESKQEESKQDKQAEKSSNAFQAQERRVMGFLRFAPVRESNWNGEKETIDFYTLSGDLESFFNYHFPQQTLHKQVVTEAESKQFPFLVPGEQAWLTIKKKRVGYLGRVSSAALKYFELPLTEAIYYGEIDLELLTKLKRRDRSKLTYEAMSLYPYVTRDVALVVEEEVMLENFIEDIRQTHECVERVSLLEVYRGKELREAKPLPGQEPIASPTEDTSTAALKSFVFRLQLRSKQKTLLSAEADHIVEHIIKKLARKHTFRLR